MSKVLVVYASKMGATKDIAAAVGSRLNTRGMPAEVRQAATVKSLAGYDSVVIGSAVYGGRWLPDAVRFAKRFTTDLLSLNVWIFESGWVGERPDTAAPSVIARKWARRLDIVTPVAVFGGRLDPDFARSFLDRMLAKRRAGDSRDWQEIHAWADSVADALVTELG